MSNIINNALYASFFSIVGTMIGAILGVLILRPSEKIIAHMNGFAAGIMLEVVVMELVPSSFERISKGVFLIYVSFGVLFMYILSKLYEEVSNDNNAFLKTAVLTATGIMIHNLPEGIIMGIGFIHSTGLGITMSLVIAIHDLPEGLVVASSLSASKINRSKILLYSFITALPTVLGCYIGVKMDWISSMLIGIFLSIVSGIMIYITLFQLIVESLRISDFFTTIKSVLFGIILGLVISILL